MLSYDVLKPLAAIRDTKYLSAILVRFMSGRSIVGGFYRGEKVEDGSGGMVKLSRCSKKKMVLGVDVEKLTRFMEVS